MLMKQRLSGLLLSIAILAVIIALVACSPKATTQNTTAPAPTQTATVSTATSPAATISATASPAATTATASATDTAQKTFTKDELAKYDGKNGNPAYIAVKGVVYDVTDVRQWSSGSHQGYKAGQDLTEAIQQSPHGTSVLKGLPVVGTYVN